MSASVKQTSVQEPVIPAGATKELPAAENLQRDSVRSSEPQALAQNSSSREAITYFQPMEEREDDQAPLSGDLIRRMFTYTRPYRSRRNWLFFLTFARGFQLPMLAWMIGQTINGPVAGRNLPGIYLHAGIYLGLVLLMVLTLHVRQRFALELGEAVGHDMRSELFRKLTSMPMSFF